GRLIASYTRAGASRAAGSADSSLESAFFDSGTLRVVRMIFLDGQQVGTIMLESDLTDISARLERIVGLVGLATFGIAFWLSRATAQRAYAPIGHLIAATRLVRERGQYDVRAQKTSDDEIGELIDDFNQMLSEIDRRDRQL